MTLVEGNPKAPFSIVTTQGVKEGTTPFSELLHFTLDPYLIMLSVKQGGIKFHFSLKSLVWLDLGLNPGVPDHWRTLYPLGQWAGICICVFAAFKKMYYLRCAWSFRKIDIILWSNNLTKSCTKDVKFLQND